MSRMFYNCSKLISLDLSSFNTSLVIYMDWMFYGCNSLLSLDLNNFDTSSTEYMNYMFKNCYSLKTLNLNNFDTRNVKQMNNMFYGCKSLIFLDLNNFDTSQTTDMLEMFYNCNSLVSLNINNFNTSILKHSNDLFHGCISLISLNLGNFETTNLLESEKMFNNINPNITLCINITNPFFSDLASSKNKCSDECFTNLEHKFIKGENKCIDKCSKSKNYLYEYNNICYSICPKGTRISSNNCYLCEDLKCNNYYNYEHTECIDIIPEGYYLNNSILKTIDKCHIKCKNCTLDSMSNNLCITCNDNNNYYPSDNINITSYIDCLNNRI